MTLTARTAALLLGGLLLGGAPLAACAQPGQLGHPPPAPAAATPVAPAPVARATVEPVSGTVDSRVTIRTPGPAVYSVRTVVLAPGASLGWHRHPGTEMAVVRTGEVTVVRQGECEPARYAVGQALFVGDAVPYRMTNDGSEPAELLVSMLLAPGAAESTDTGPACPQA